MRSRHTIRCFLSFSLVLSFKDLYLVLTCIYLNIEDNFNFKLGGMLIVWLFDEFCVVLVDSLETICFHLFKKKIRKMRKRKKWFGLQWCLWFMLYSHASLLSLRIWLKYLNMTIYCLFWVLSVTLVHLKLGTSTLTCNLWGMKCASNCY